jgi:hypothetical protein
MRSKFYLLKSKQVALATVALCVAGVIVFVGFKINQSHTLNTPSETTQKKTEPPLYCTYSDSGLTYTLVAETAAKNDQKVFKELVDRLEKTEGFDSDPNCAFGAFLYYLNDHKLERMQQLYDQMANSYDEMKGFSIVFKPWVNNLNDVKKIIDSQTDSAKEILDNKGIEIPESYRR